MFPRLKQRRFLPSLTSLLLVLIVSELLRAVAMSQLGGALRSSCSPPSARTRRLRGGRGEGSGSLPRRSEWGKTRGDQGHAELLDLSEHTILLPGWRPANVQLNYPPAVRTAEL